jgi:ABC-type Mn2+/Zn2+ transport system ATPase subunit
MSTLENLENWVRAHPQEADEPFMNVSTQRTFTLNQLLAAIKQEAEMGVTMVDQDLLALKNRVAEWLR